MSAMLNNPKAIADAGERIYREKFQTELEEKHSGEFVAINVIDETAHIGQSPEAAFEAARRDDPSGVFHLIRVGYIGAFHMSYQYGRNGTEDWLFR